MSISSPMGMVVVTLDFFGFSSLVFLIMSMLRMDQFLVPDFFLKTVNLHYPVLFSFTCLYSS